MTSKQLAQRKLAGSGKWILRIFLIKILMLNYFNRTSPGSPGKEFINNLKTYKHEKFNQHNQGFIYYP